MRFAGFGVGGTDEKVYRDAALSGRVFTVGHCSIPPHSEAGPALYHTNGGRSVIAP